MLVVSKSGNCAGIAEALPHLPRVLIWHNPQGSYEALRGYMRRISVDAYTRKAAAMEEFEPGLMNEAQRWVVVGFC